jgi:DNA-directed RNA polymerase subunit M/transcription elongation factor TFIIS
MEQISKAMFQERGLSEPEAFLLASQLKYGDSAPQTFTSQRHYDSALNLAWMDRVLAKCAHLEVNTDLGASFNTLAKLTGHQNDLDEVKAEDKRIAELIDTVKAERKEGFLVCRKDGCKSKAIKIDQKQTRSADEPMTLFALCEDCGMQWTVKG